MTRWLSLHARARVHPASRNPFTYDICWKITAPTGVEGGEGGEWQAARRRPGGFVFSKGGHVDTCIKVPNLNLGSFATICPSLIELSIDSLQQPSILSLLMLPSYKYRYAYTQFNLYLCEISCKTNASIIEYRRKKNYLNNNPYYTRRVKKNL